MAMKKMNINMETLERIARYFDNRNECNGCPIHDKCRYLSKETCYDSMIEAFTTDYEPKDYMVEVHLDGQVYIPITAINKKHALEKATDKAHEMVKDYFSCKIDVNPDRIIET